MIVRLVKITLLPGKKDEFISLFKTVEASINNFEGCMHVELLSDTSDENIVFTYSKWASNEQLQKYRQSALFEGTWKNAKILFSQKAEAWSLSPVKNESGK
jgi:quinol monooxygenase YgiN